MSSEFGTHLNINILCYHYRNSHYKDRAVSWPSYLYNGNPILGQTIFILRWDPDLYHNLVIVGLYLSYCAIPLEWSCCLHDIFIIGCHFYPRPVLAFGYCRCLRLSVCVCVRPCVNHELVRAITHDPFQLGSPNLGHRCKRPWLRSLLFWGVIDLDLQGQILLQSQNLPHFELVCAITHHPFKPGPPNLDQRC